MRFRAVLGVSFGYELREAGRGFGRLPRWAVADRLSRCDGQARVEGAPCWTCCPIRVRPLSGPATHGEDLQAGTDVLDESYCTVTPLGGL